MQMHYSISHCLRKLRQEAKLTNHELAKLADVPASLISGLQNDNRRVGEYQARKIGKALRLDGKDLEQFIYAAINTSTEKVLQEALPYPSWILNALAMQLARAGITPELIQDIAVSGDEYAQNIHLIVGNGQRIAFKTQLICA